MVIRKPYAFIIKHFRFIHLALLACLIFLQQTLRDIYNLISDLQSTNTYIYEGTDIYITKMVYYVIIIGLLLSGIVYWLFKEKKKPTRLYLTLLIYLVALLFVFPYLYGQLKVLQTTVSDIDHLILLKDVSLLSFAPSYVFMFVCLLRGLGFNLKQFNFSKDIADMKIEDADSAEFEVSIGKNSYKYKRAIRRTLREIKYFIIENKLMLTTIVVIICLILSGFGFYYYQKYLKRLSESDVTSVDNITYTVRNSYITEYDYNGTKLDNDHKYVVVDLTLYNSYSKAKKLDLTKITLTNSKLIYYPVMTRNGRFYDMGTPYEKDQMINAGESIEASLTFELPATTTSKDFTLRVQYEVEGSGSKLVTLYRKFDIKAQEVDSKTVTSNLNKGETINVNVLGVNEFDITINSYAIQDVYNNKYVTCYDLNTCRALSNVISSTKTSTNTMLVLDYKANIYEDANFTKKFNTINKIFANYVKISYTIDDKTYTEDANIITNSDVDGKVFLSVDRLILKADSIDVTFYFRNLKYVISLTNDITNVETTVTANDADSSNTDEEGFITTEVATN